MYTYIKKTLDLKSSYTTATTKREIKKGEIKKRIYFVTSEVTVYLIKLVMEKSNPIEIEALSN